MGRLPEKLDLLLMKLGSAASSSFIGSVAARPGCNLPWAVGTAVQILAWPYGQGWPVCCTPRGCEQCILCLLLDAVREELKTNSGSVQSSAWQQLASDSPALWGCASPELPCCCCLWTWGVAARESPPPPARVEVNVKFLS